MPEETLSINESEILSLGGRRGERASLPAPLTRLRAEKVCAEVRPAALASDLSFPPPDLCGRLRTAVESAASKNADSMKALRATVREFTAVLRDGGITPEAVLISLKAVINDRPLPLVPPHLSDWTGYQLREKISTWSIEEFFSEKTRESRLTRDTDGMIATAAGPLRLVQDPQLHGASGGAFPVQKGLTITDEPGKEYWTLSAEISNVLSDRTSAVPIDRISLRDAVCGYVAAERATGTTLKCVIQSVKEILRKAEEEAASATNATERRDDGLAQQLVVWCMEFHHPADLTSG